MDRIDAYRDAAQSFSRHAFKTEHAGYYLLKRPLSNVETSVSESVPGEIQYQTITLNTVDATAGSRAHLNQLWAIAPVRKKAGNPFPNRISIGRAPNCDIAVRLPFVSKLHAHILVESDGSLRIRDNGSSNGLTLNGIRIEAGQETKINLGDCVGFGQIVFVLVDAEMLYEILST